MTRQVPFTVHEAVLLLDAFLKADSRQVSEGEAIKNCSEALRRMAVANQIEINDKYRSVYGITFQMKRMKSAFYGETMGLEATKLFTKAVFMYHNEREKYDGLLEEAQLMSSMDNRKRAAFVAWISPKILPTMFSRLFLAYGEIEKIARHKDILHCSIFDLSNLEPLYKIKELILFSLEIQTLYEDQLSIMILSLEYLIQHTAEEISSSGPKDQSPGSKELEGSPKTPSKETSHPGFFSLSKDSEAYTPMTATGKGQGYAECEPGIEDTATKQSIPGKMTTPKHPGSKKGHSDRPIPAGPVKRFEFPLFPGLTFATP